MLIAISIYFIIGGLIAEIAVRNNPRTIGFIAYMASKSDTMSQLLHVEMINIEELEGHG